MFLSSFLMFRTVYNFHDREEERSYNNSSIAFDAFAQVDVEICHTSIDNMSLLIKLFFVKYNDRDIFVTMFILFNIRIYIF